jgi:hypothetical protein
MAAARVLERHGPQQAADVIGAKRRRLSFGHHGSASGGRPKSPPARALRRA